MNTLKKKAAAAALTAGLIGGGAAGLILGGTTVSGAQETTTTVAADQSTDQQAPPDGERPDPSARHAEALAPLVEAGTITQAQADAVIAALAEAGPPEGEGHGGPGGEHGGRGGPGLDAAAEALGITADELRTALDDDQTIAEVAAAKGVDVQTVIDAMVAGMKAHLDEEVAAGEHTQAEADEKLADATERITDSVNNGFPQRGERPADAPEDGAATN
jgi:uncharacterized protein YidB (DUF937 family)